MQHFCEVLWALCSTTMLLWLAGSVCMLLAWLWFRGNTATRDIPGPPGLPFFGNLLQLGDGQPHLLFTQWAKLYGPVFKFRTGFETAVVVNDLDSLSQVLVTNGKVFGGRPIPASGNTGIVFSDPSDRWKTTRKVVHGSLKAFGKDMGRIENLALQVTKDILATFEASQGEPVDPEPIIFDGTLKMVSLLLWGENFDKDSDQFKFSKRRQQISFRLLSVSRSVQLLLKFPWLGYFGNKMQKLVKEHRAINSAFWDLIWRENLQKWEPENMETVNPPIAHALLHHNYKCKDESQQFSDFHMRTVCFQMESAGTRTTASTFLALLNILLHQPTAQAKIHSEIDEEIGDRNISLDDRANLPFTNATILELLRYTSVASLSVPHKTVSQVKLAGHVLPAETTVICNLWALHHDDQFWDKPFEFRPERFLDDRGDLVPSDHPHRKHLLPFGAGPRVCIGETIALARLFLWTVTILQKFELKPEGETPTVSCDPRTYQKDAILKCHPFKMRFIHRASATN